jgi:Tfp pilus assembly protein PilX
MRPATFHKTERGFAILSVLISTMVLTLMGIGLVGIMNTDVTHAGIQGVVSKSFYAAQTGLQQAQIYAQSSLSTPPAGVSASFAGGSYTFWVDAGPAAGSPCGAGYRTVEAVGSFPFLARTISTRLRACGPASPTAIGFFGVNSLHFQGASGGSRAFYLAPYNPPGVPCAQGNGASVGSFREINFQDTGVRVNALTGQGVTAHGLGTVPDYSLFCFASLAAYQATNGISAFGTIYKAEPQTGPVPNPCGTTPFACVDAMNNATDIPNIASLRAVERNVYMGAIGNAVFPQVTPCAGAFLNFCSSTYAGQALVSTANQFINQAAGLMAGDATLLAKTNSDYTPQQFTEIVTYLASHPAAQLRGAVYVNGSLTINATVSLGTTDATLVVQGDLTVNGSLSNTHDLTTQGGRQVPGLILFGSGTGPGSGVFTLNGTYTGDGLIYTSNGLQMTPNSAVDQIGALYNNAPAGSTARSEVKNASYVLRFDPQALQVLNLKNFSQLSWQQCLPAGC